MLKVRRLFLLIHFYTDDQAFSLDDITLFSNTRQLSLRDSPDFKIEDATKVHYAFTNQKNMDKSQVIAHVHSGDPLCCPVLAKI